MSFDPYLWTWLAHDGEGLMLALVWLAVAGWQLARRRFAFALSLAALALTSTALLATHLLPLLTSAPLPASDEAVIAARALPFLGFGALAIWLRPRAHKVDIDLVTLSPVALVGFGWPAWLFALALLGRGWLAPAAARRVLALGIALLALSYGVDAQRLALEPHVVQYVPGGTDTAVRTVAAASGGLAVAGWALVTSWATRAQSPAVS